MDAFAFDLTTIAALWMGGALLMVPLLGMTLRFGFAPAIRAVADFRRAGKADGDASLRERVRELEARVAAMERDHEEDVAEYSL